MKNLLRLFLLLVIPFGAQAQAQVLGGAVAAYPFCGNTSDIVGNNNGTGHNITLVSNRFGTTGTAYYFNGLNSSISLGTSSQLKPVKGAVSVWAKPDAFSQHGSGYLLNPIVLTKNQTGNNCYEGYAIGFATAYGPMQFHTTITQPFCNQIVGVYNTVQLQNWYHIVLTWSIDTMKTYVNGVLIAAQHKGFSNTYLSTDSVMIGYSANVQNDRYFEGTIDDVVIFNHMLSQAEVTALYNAADLCALGIDENSGQDFQIRLFPNPATEQMQIQRDDDLPIQEITIRDVSGRIVFAAANMHDASVSVDCHDFSPGLYFAEVRSEDRLRVLKFIRQ